MKLLRLLPALALFASASLLSLHAAHAGGKVVQIDTSAVFNVRPINTVVNGAVVPMDHDIDGNGGLCTLSAAKILGGSTEHVIPDNAVFPATDKHPEVVLAYANDDGKKNFARRHAQGEDTFDFAVPEG